jgi:hypothetical protein
VLHDAARKNFQRVVREKQSLLCSIQQLLTAAENNSEDTIAVIAPPQGDDTPAGEAYAMTNSDVVLQQLKRTLATHHALLRQQKNSSSSFAETPATTTESETTTATTTPARKRKKTRSTAVAAVTPTASVLMSPPRSALATYPVNLSFSSPTSLAKLAKGLPPSVTTSDSVTQQEGGSTGVIGKMDVEEDEEINETIVATPGSLKKRYETRGSRRKRGAK